MSPLDLLLPAVGGGCLIGFVVRTAREVALWVDERRTDRLAR